MEYREAKQKQELKSTNIYDYEAGDILELENKSDGERFVGIVVGTGWIHTNTYECEKKYRGIYDLESECVFEDLENYEVVRKREGFLQLTD